MRKKGSTLLIIPIILVIVIGLVVFVFLKKSSEDSKFNTFLKNNFGDGKFSSGPKCPDNLEGLFKNTMVDVEKIAVLTPLGNVNGTSHILPVDHVYFRVKDDVGRHEVYAPADMVIDNITLHKLEWADQPSRSEYYYEAQICKGLRIWVAGFNELSPGLKSAFESSEKDHQEDQTNAEKIVNESTRLNLEVKAGDLIGYSGGEEEKPWASIEITVMNDNLEKSGVNWNYYGDRSRKRGIMCFADLYVKDLKDKLYVKFGNLDYQKGFIPRTIEPVCGTIYQNIQGTIQGDWFYGKPKSNENLESLGRVLAFLHLNTDPTRGVISVAGTITERPFSISFDPVHAGTVNREPGEVKADGDIYCYDIDSQDLNGKILTQLVDEHHLKIEYQKGKCNERNIFIKSFIFER